MKVSAQGKSELDNIAWLGYLFVILYSASSLGVLSTEGKPFCADKSKRKYMIWARPKISLGESFLGHWDDIK